MTGSVVRNWDGKTSTSRAPLTPALSRRERENASSLSVRQNSSRAGATAEPAQNYETSGAPVPSLARRASGGRGRMCVAVRVFLKAKTSSRADTSAEPAKNDETSGATIHTDALHVGG